MPDPVYRSVVVTQLVNKVLQRGKRSIAEKIVYDALDEHRAEDRRRPGRDAQARGRERAPAARGEEPPSRWRHLPGAGRGAPPPGHHARDPLDRRATRASAARRRWPSGSPRAARREQRARGGDQAQGRPAEDGGVQQGVRALPVVMRSVAEGTRRPVSALRRRSGRPHAAPPEPALPAALGTGLDPGSLRPLRPGPARLRRPAGSRAPRLPGARSRSETERETREIAENEVKGRVIREFPWRGCATSGSWRTSTRARPRRPSASSTTRARPTRSARSTRAPRSWTGWSRSRSAASRSPRAATTCKWRDTLDQHHRHARPRRLHRRGRAVAARARRRGRGVRRGRRRRAADRDGVAPGQQVQRAAHVLRQQDGPRRRRLLPLRRHDQGPPRRRPSPLVQLPIGAESDFRGVVDLLEMKALVWDDGMGESYDTVDIPAELQADAEHWRHELVDVVSQLRRERAREVRRRRGDHRRRPPHGAPRAAPSRGEVVPVLCGTAFKNKGVQPLLDAVVDYLPSPRRRAADRGHRRQGRRGRSSARPTTTSRSPRSRSRS